MEGWQPAMEAVQRATVWCPLETHTGRDRDRQGTDTVTGTAGQRRHPVPDLFQLCLQLVAGRLHQVDSLLGFPELVGQQLVTRAAQLAVFDGPDERCCRAMGLVCAAYPYQVLYSLQLGDLVTLSEYEPVLESVWSALSRVDLSGCRLGDHHPVLEYLATSDRVSHMYLRGCALSDAGIRRLTLPARMRGAGSGALQYADLRDNHFGHRSLMALCRINPRYLAASLTLNAGERAALLDRGYRPVDTVSFPAVTTAGWLADVVQKWSSGCRRPRPRPPPATAAARFCDRLRWLRRGRPQLYRRAALARNSTCRELFQSDRIQLP